MVILPPMSNSIFDYLDYREFLKDYYHEKKLQMPFFSYRLIGRSVGMDSSYLIKVLNGSLHISNSKIGAFEKLFKFTEQESAYFEALVNFNKARTESQRKLFFERLFKISRIKAHCLTPHQYEFFRKWYYSAIWALIQMKPRIPDLHALANACEPSITTSQATDSVNLLLKLGLISKNDKGLLVVTSNHLTVPEQWSSEAIVAYQHEMINCAHDAVERIGKKSRNISSVTITFKESQLKLVNALIVEFRKSLIALAKEQADPDRAYQLNVQFFPMTKPEDRK